MGTSKHLQSIQHNELDLSTAQIFCKDSPSRLSVHYNHHHPHDTIEACSGICMDNNNGQVPESPTKIIFIVDSHSHTRKNSGEDAHMINDNANVPESLNHHWLNDLEASETISLLETGCVEWSTLVEPTLSVPPLEAQSLFQPPQDQSHSLTALAHLST
jgi:hypothetical protein